MTARQPDPDPRAADGSLYLEEKHLGGIALGQAPEALPTRQGGSGQAGEQSGGRSVTAWWPNKGKNISSNECASVFSLAVPAVWYQQDILVPATHTPSPQHPQCTPPSLQLLAFISQPQQALDGLKQEAACALWYELLQGKGEG